MTQTGSRPSVVILPSFQSNRTLKCRMGTWPRVTLTTFHILPVPKHNQLAQKYQVAAFCNLSCRGLSSQPLVLLHPSLHCAAWNTDVMAADLAATLDLEDKILPQSRQSCEWEGVSGLCNGDAMLTMGCLLPDFNIKENKTFYCSHCYVG